MTGKLDRIKDWGERVHAAGFRVAVLAQNCGVSERDLRKYLQSRLGVRPRDWILRTRLKRAREFLREGKSVKETAALTGFSQQGHFARCFEKLYGVNPGHYARGKHRPPR